jgi:hypothetical protein
MIFFHNKKVMKKDRRKLYFLKMTFHVFSLFLKIVKNDQTFDTFIKK